MFSRYCLVIVHLYKIRHLFNSTVMQSFEVKFTNTILVYSKRA